MNNPVITERLVAVAQAARAAGHGEKKAIYEQACRELGLSLATLHRKLNQLTVKPKRRKQRSDAGKSALSYDEAMLVATVIIESRRGHGKRLYSFVDAIAHLRDCNLLRAERLDARTGELKPMSESAITRAMRSYGLHPEQLLAPDPHGEMMTDHPNHVWQIDASLCVLYYLKPKPRGANGLHVMDRDKFYKNKPQNLKNIMADRVWSYEITDHASGWVYFEYVMGAESSENLCSVLINAMQERGGADLMHGIPRILYMDPGSANTSAMTQSLCRALGIEPIAHAPGNARATGQVENARNLIERKFESGLRFQPVADLAELNALAAKWRAKFNALAVHRRHGKPRTEVWLLITAEQLIKAPSVEVCRNLAVSAPVKRKVRPSLRVSYEGAEYDVRGVPGVMVHQWLEVCSSWRDDCVQILLTDAEGHEVRYQAPRLKKNDFGYAEGATRFGDGYAAMPETAAQKARKAIEQLVTGTDTTAEAAAARKAKTLPLDGRFDPYKSLDADDLPTYLPKRGTEHELKAPMVQALRLNLVELAKRLRARLGDDWTPEHYAWLAQHHPEGAPEDALDEIEAATRRRQPTALRVAGGAGC